MVGPDEAVAELTKYLKKLNGIIQYDATFNFIDTKLVKKNKVDDILCCIESSFPDIYKKYLQHQGVNKLKSNFYYIKLKGAIQNKFLWSTSLYWVRSEEVKVIIPSIIANLEPDMKFLYSDASGMI